MCRYLVAILYLQVAQHAFKVIAVQRQQRGRRKCPHASSSHILL